MSREEPDVRWSLANERTALAYTRTALSLIVSGLAVAGSKGIADTPVWLAVLGVPLVMIGIVVAVAGRRRYLAADEAVRTGEPLGPPTIAAAVPLAIAVIGAAALVVAIVEAFRS